MDSAFFEGLRQQIIDRRLTQRAREAYVEENRGFVGEAMKTVHQLVTMYEGKLQEMGYRSHLTVGPERIEQRLVWADQQYLTLTFHGDPETGELLTSITPSIVYEPTKEAKRIGRRDWDEAEVVAIIQDFVESFTDAADEHDGLN